MGKQWFTKFISIRMHSNFPFAIGIGIACVTFLITYTLASEWNSNIIILVLMIPGFVTSSVLEKDSVFLAALVSSLFYGSMGGFLASNRRGMQLFSILLIVLVIFFGCYLSFLIAHTD